MDTNQLTPEEQEWFQQPVTAQVEQDDRAWLDTMLEMRPHELRNYAVFQYAIPEAAANAVERDELIQMVIVANRAGGGQSVSQQEYRYLEELLGTLDPMTSMPNADSKPLYLIRGKGVAAQVYDKIHDKWLNLDQTLASVKDNRTHNRTVAGEAAPSVGTTNPTVPAAPSVNLDALIGVIDSLKRKDLEVIATQVGIKEATSEEKFPGRKELIAEIKKVNEAK